MFHMKRCFYEDRKYRMFLKILIFICEVIKNLLNILNGHLYYFFKYEKYFCLIRKNLFCKMKEHQ